MKDSPDKFILHFLKYTNISVYDVLGKDKKIYRIYIVCK